MNQQAMAPEQDSVVGSFEIVIILLMHSFQASQSEPTQTSSFSRSTTRRIKRRPTTDENILPTKPCSVRDSWRPGHGSTVRTFIFWKRPRTAFRTIRQLKSTRTSKPRNPDTRAPCRSTKTSAKRWVCRCRRSGSIRMG